MDSMVNECNKEIEKQIWKCKPIVQHVNIIARTYKLIGKHVERPKKTQTREPLTKTIL